MIGQLISHYKILEKLGEGGMGIVYKAHDTKLDRTVALKFLPEHHATSESDRVRFVQEAKAVATLSHPNICTIHQIDEHDNNIFIVMEYVEGQTLKDKQNIPLKQAIEIAIQIADGLTAAHEKGVVHRDIKPDNIMIRKDGRVQVMDFGLALFRGVSRMTKEGRTVGTAAYMSPEQVQGMDIDHRSDIFSLGILLYELFTGELPFKGTHDTALGYEIVNVDPAPMSSVNPGIDPSLDLIVLECLAKEPSERYQSVAEIGKDLRRLKRESSKQRLSRTFATQPGLLQKQASIASGSTLASKSTHIAWWLTGILLVITLFLMVRQFTISSNLSAPVHSSIVIPKNIYLHSFGQWAGPSVISPDGRQIVFSGITPDGIVKLYVRSLGSFDVRPLDGTAGAHYPFWSPDGRSVAFFADGKLKRVDIAGGSVISICDAWNGRGGSWGIDGSIVYAKDALGPLYRVSSAGGTPEELTTLDNDRAESTHRWPYFLPDGKHFLYFSRTATTATQAEGHAVFVASLDGRVNKLLVHTSSNAIYASGYILFVRGSSLMAQKFDIKSLELKGDPKKIVEQIIDDPNFNLGVFSASQTGMLTYQTGQAQSGAQLLLMDRAGNISSRIGDIIEHWRPRFSPDGRRISVAIFDVRSLRLNLWNYDVRTGSRNRITSGYGEEYPVWSPDGNRMAHALFIDNQWILSLRNVAGTGGEEQLQNLSGRPRPYDWSPDGNYLLIGIINPINMVEDLWIYPLTGEKKPIPFLNSEFQETEGRISPDGRWVAFSSDQSGEFEIYLKLLSGNNSQTWKISTHGGWLPRWGANANEIFFVDSNNKLNLATLQYRNNELELTELQSLFTAPIFLGDYDVSPDGETIVVNKYLEYQDFPPLSIIMNWNTGLQ
jgi:eukaryotic-like serine/threonine-protein kinase